MQGRRGKDQGDTKWEGRGKEKDRMTGKGRRQKRGDESREGKLRFGCWGIDARDNASKVTRSPSTGVDFNAAMATRHGRVETNACAARG